jgi:hypothetical protein
MSGNLLGCNPLMVRQPSRSSSRLIALSKLQDGSRSPLIGNEEDDADYVAPYGK